MKLRTLLGVVIATVVITGLAACGGGGSSSTTGVTETLPTSSSTSSTSTTTPTEPTTIRIVFKDGKVVGGLVHETVSKDEKVALVVTSDVADEVHLHGYDKHVDVVPGKPARLTFVASLPGRFVVELENRALQIADLEVSQ